MFPSLPRPRARVVCASLRALKAVLTRQLRKILPCCKTALKKVDARPPCDPAHCSDSLGTPEKQGDFKKSLSCSIADIVHSIELVTALFCLQRQQRNSQSHTKVANNMASSKREARVRWRIRRMRSTRERNTQNTLTGDTVDSTLILHERVVGFARHAVGQKKKAAKRLHTAQVNFSSGCLPQGDNVNVHKKRKNNFKKTSFSFLRTCSDRPLDAACCVTTFLFKFIHVSLTGACRSTGC